MLDNIFSEKQILSQLITDYNINLAQRLNENDFYDLDNRNIFKSLVKNKGNIELVINETFLENKIEKIVLEKVSLSKLDHHIEILKKLTKKRNLIEFSEKLKNSVFIDEISNNLGNELENILNSDISLKEGKMAYDLCKQYLEDYYKKPNFLIFGNDLDKALFLEEGDLIVLAARPSMGKTAFKLQLALNASKNEQSVLCFSLEMEDKQLIQRAMASECDLELEKIRKKTLTEEEKIKLREKIYEKFRNYKLKIHDDIFDLNSIKDIAIKYKKEFGLDLLMIDYLQLINTMNKKNRTQEIGEITRELKKFAKNEKIRIILLSQLSRQVENRSDKRPVMADLRDSGEIEQDVDICIMLYRDEYYNENSELKNIIEIIIRKQRQGILGTIPMFFEGNKQRIRDLTKLELERVKNVISKCD